MPIKPAPVVSVDDTVSIIIDKVPDGRGRLSFWKRIKFQYQGERRVRLYALPRDWT